MNEREIHIPPEVDKILREYVLRRPSSHDLAITVANEVEASLAKHLPEIPWYPAATLTRLYSRNQRRDFPDVHVRGFDNPRDTPEFKEWGVTLKTVKHYMLYCIQELLGTVGQELPANAYIKRLLDQPDICQRLIEIFLEHRVAQFHEKIKQNKHFRLGQQRLESSKNAAQHRQPASLGSYIARSLCSPDFAPISARAGVPGTLEEKMQSRNDLIRDLPLDPDRISDEAFIKSGLAPEWFTRFTLQARRRCKMLHSREFAELLSRAVPHVRAHKSTKGKPKTTARIIHFKSAKGEERIGIFVTKTDILTRVTGEEPVRNQHNKMAETELHIFMSIEDARDSQQHAIEWMQERMAEYAKLYNSFSKYSKKKPEDKAAYLSGIVTDARKVFAKKTGFHDQLMIRYLNGSEEGKPVASVLEQPSLIGTILARLKFGMDDLHGKIREIRAVKNQI